MEVIDQIQIFSIILSDFKSSYIIPTEWTFNYLFWVLKVDLKYTLEIFSKKKKHINFSNRLWY